AGLLADLLAVGPAFGAGPILGSEVVDDPSPGERRWEGLAAGGPPRDLAVGRFRRRGHHGELGLDRPRGDQGQLARASLLPLLAVSLAEELLDLMLESLDEACLLAQCLRLLADLPVRGGQVVGQRRVAISHDRMGAIGPGSARSATSIHP